jgi:RimJ/RimL family protein N-acetyltransferase
MRIEFARSFVAPGESWAATADRLAEGRGPVLAVDLSEELLRFEVDDEHRLAVRPMTEGDFPDVSRWVQTAHVAKWWDEHQSLEQVAAHYGPALTGVDPTRLWVLEVNGRSVGFTQDYRIDDHPEWALLSGMPGAIGFDYAIGEPAWVGRGIGTKLLWVFLRDIVVPAYPGAPILFAAPDHRNARSLRLLAKLGFTQGAWFDEPQSGGGVETVVGCSVDVVKVLGSAVVTDE